MNPYEEMQVLHKQIATLHKEIGVLYARMAKFNSDYQWSAIQRLIDSNLEKVNQLRLQLSEVTDRFINWDKKNKE